MRAALATGLDRGRAAVLTSALDKLTAATGEAAAAVDVRLAVEGAPAVVSALGEAVLAGRRLRLRYVTAGDVMSVREVDPIRLLSEDEHSYLLAWCYRADDERLFRVDRVLEAEVLDVPVAAHVLSAASSASATFSPDPEGELVTLELESRARWIAEQVPVESVENLPDGAFRVTLRVVDPAWLRHLLLQVGGEVRSVSPARIGTAAAAAARAALAAYGEGADVRSGDSSEPRDRPVA